MPGSAFFQTTIPLCAHLLHNGNRLIKCFFGGFFGYAPQHALFNRQPAENALFGKCGQHFLLLRQSGNKFVEKFAAVNKVYAFDFGKLLRQIMRFGKAQRCCLL